MREWGISMETNLFVNIISHITITGYKTKTTNALHAYKIHNKLFVVSSLNNASPHPEPALTHLTESNCVYGEMPSIFCSNLMPVLQWLSWSEHLTRVQKTQI